MINIEFETQITLKVGGLEFKTGGIGSFDKISHQPVSQTV
jgi:hypothetical protein